MQRRALLNLMALTPFVLPTLTGCDAVKDMIPGKDGDGDGKDSDGEGSKGKKGKKGKTTKAEDGVVPAPKPGDVPTLKVGAWSKYRMGSGGEATWAIVDRRNDNEWLVDAKIDGPMKLFVQSWVRVPDLRDLQGMKMLDAKFRMNKGPIQKLTMGPTSPAAMMFQKFMSTATSQKLEGLPQEDVTVEAGTFKGCYKWSNENTVMGIKVEETIWTHPGVPLPAMVKSEPKNGKGGFELIAYSEKGAKKSF
jgi:hypothetical protein